MVQLLNRFKNQKLMLKLLKKTKRKKNNQLNLKHKTIKFSKLEQEPKRNVLICTAY